MDHDWRLRCGEYVTIFALTPPESLRGEGLMSEYPSFLSEQAFSPEGRFISAATNSESNRSRLKRGSYQGTSEIVKPWVPPRQSRAVSLCTRQRDESAV